MKAWRVHGTGAPETTFVLEDIPEPTPDPLAGLGLELCDDPYAACEGANVLVVLTEWPQFRELDLAKVAVVMTRPSIVDTRNLLEPADARAAGCIYQGMGRS